MRIKTLLYPIRHNDMGKNRDNNSDDVNTHHIIWKCNHKRAKVDEETNKMLFSVLKHRALNTLFNDKQSPHEQLAVMLEIWRPVLSLWVRRALQDILNLPKDVFYKKELIKHGK